jgi:hypothetical protein
LLGRYSFGTKKLPNDLKRIRKDSLSTMNPYDLPGLKAYDLDNEADAFEAQKRSRRCELIKEQIAELQGRIAVLEAMLEREERAYQ